MKSLTLLFALFFSLSMLGQKSNRVLISGSVENKENEVEGISIFNESSSLGTITNEEGKFTIDVQEDDVLLFSAIQFQKFKVVIDKGVIKEKKLRVFMNEIVTVLEEVIVRPYDLTGNVRVDVARIKVQLPEMDSKILSEKTYESFDFKPDFLSPVVNIAADVPNYSNGIDMANIFRTVFLKRKEDKRNQPKTLDTEIRKIYSNEFFQQNLDIPEEEITPFISYCENQGLTYDLIEDKNQLKLIDFLLVKCANYKVEMHAEKKD
ncbi:MAG: carboxypeptidase-like regulatory domain-containing protein [Flavobacteriaceae bacterium]|nr:carboxypeptidase-like regulatory domain-containing protein [Flavobacteriaceae bacterium]